MPDSAERAKLRAELDAEYASLREQALGTKDGVGDRLQAELLQWGIGGVTRLPRGAQNALIGALARLARRIDAKHADAARVFLRQALPCAATDGPQLEERVLQAYRHLFRITLDSQSFERHVALDRRGDHYELEACDAFHELVASKRGAFMITPHVGDWEAGSAFVTDFGPEEFWAVVKPPRNRRVSLRLLEARERRGVRVLPRHGGLGVVPKVLASGAWIGLLLDQRPNGRYVTAPFFRRPAFCERSAATLIRRTRAPLVFGSTYRTETPWRYRIVMQSVVEPDELRGLDPVAIQTRVNEEMERLILRAPDQYFWLHDRYRHAPPAEAAE